jgi:hypothetical protein
MTSEWGSGQRRDHNLLGQIPTDRKTRATHRTDQIPAIGQLSHLQLLAKSEIPQTLTRRTIDALNAQITAHLRLVQRDGTVGFEIVGERVAHEWTVPYCDWIATRKQKALDDFL